MLKRNTVFIMLTIIVAILFVSIIFITSGSPNDKLNGFNRRINAHQPKLLYTVPYKEQIDEIVDVNDNGIYFQTNSSKVISVQPNRTKLEFKQIEYEIDSNFENKKCRIRLKHDKLIFFANNTKYVGIYSLITKKVKSIRVGNNYSSFAVIDSNKVMIRMLDNSGINRIFSRVNLTNNEIISESHLSAKTNDGGIKTDGILNWDSSVQQLVYTYYYRNGYLCFNADFDTIYKERTIDTLTQLQIKIQKNGSAITLSGTPNPVSVFSNVSNGKLYIEAALKADNESFRFFEKQSVVDVYDLAKHRYVTSFYIPWFDKQKASSFIIHEDLLVVLFGSVIQVFKLNIN